MEYFLVRLLQTFSEFSIDWKTQPESSKTPASWIPTDEPENIGYEVGLTMSVKVYFILFHGVSSYVGFCFVLLGCPMGKNERNDIGFLRGARVVLMKL